MSSDNENRTMEEAMQIAIDLAQQGTSDVQKFLNEVRVDATKVAKTADARFKENRTEQSKRIGELVTYATTELLDYAVEVKEEIENHTDRRSHIIDQLASLVSSVGAVIIDTTNGAAGEGAARPGVAVARQMVVELDAGCSVSRYAWVINRSSASITAPVTVIPEFASGVRIEVPPALELPARQRRQLKIDITADKGFEPTTALITVGMVTNLVVMIEKPKTS